jgi:hypothetical protein
MSEFVCCECGNRMVHAADDQPPDPPLCLICVTNPGWFRDQRLRQLLHPEHDGLEAFERVLASQNSHDQ